jgi:GNAT superfamily N-acetyltransferase
MSALDKIMARLSVANDDAPCWIELGRDLHAPITRLPLQIQLTRRWADDRDIEKIAMLEAFVKDIAVMSNALTSGDRCLLLERGGRIGAFAWITFRDYPLAIWHTLRLPPKAAYLVYIFVRPEFRRQGVGTYLLGCVMHHLQGAGYDMLISGMQTDWERSIRLHRKVGFKLRKRFIKRKLIRVIPVPPRKVEVMP